MKAILLSRIKEIYGSGVIEGVIWQVPDPVRRSKHRIKYRLAFIVDGERRVGYDNEAGKGDHKHVRGKEIPYRFKDVPTLIDDFLRDVKENES
jgi:hypothetical protein